jgi:alpha-L-fucosidase
MAWPTNGKLTIHALANGNGTVQQVSLLGHQGNLDFRQTAQGLEITLPSKPPCNYAVALKINGASLTK